jgi:hypothetical protein
MYEGPQAVPARPFREGVRRSAVKSLEMKSGVRREFEQGPTALRIPNSNIKLLRGRAQHMVTF